MESQSLCTDNPIKTQDQKENVFPDRDYEQRIQRESFDSWFNDTILVSKEGEMMAFQFDPTDGLLNVNVFPTVPESETAARQQFQTLLNQIRDAINAHLAESANKHITESGQNENGNYIKFDDGTQEVWIQTSLPYNNFANLQARWVFPASFATNPIVTVSPKQDTMVYSDGSPMELGATTYSGVSSTAVTLQQWRIDSGSSFISGDKITVSARAIGRWK
jgi:hypothetical protein